MGSNRNRPQGKTILLHQAGMLALVDIWDEHGLLGIHLNLANRFRRPGLTPQQAAELWPGRQPENGISHVISWTQKSRRVATYSLVVCSEGAGLALSHLSPGMTFALGHTRIERILHFYCEIRRSGAAENRLL